MCIGGSPAYATPQRETAAFQDAPPVVTGKQTGVENPKDTKKVTEELKIKRQKKEGTYVDPNLSRTEELLTVRKSGGLGAKERSLRAARLKRGYSRGNPTKAQRMAKARMNRKSSNSDGGRKGGRV
jgi:hypothetical protein